MKRLIAIIAMMVFMSNALGSNVILYEHDNFGGISRSYSSDTPILWDFNDIVSSLYIPPDYCVILFGDSNFGDPAEMFCHSTGSVGDFNDWTSSFKLIKKPSPPYVILYEHDNFEGRSVIYSDDAANFEDINAFNDIASSLEVTPGDCVTLFTDSNFGGPASTFCCSVPHLGHFSDIASSLRLWKLGKADLICDYPCPGIC